MKKYLIILLLCLWAFGPVAAQRMLPGQRGLELGAGLMPGTTFGSDHYINLGMTFNGQSGNYGLMAMEYAHTYTPYRQYGIPSETYTAEGGYSFQLAGNLRKTITLNAALSVLAGYGSINRGDSVLYDGAILKVKEGLVYGAALRLSGEAYLSDSFVLMITGRTKLLKGAIRNKFQPSLGLGLRFNF